MSLSLVTQYHGVFQRLLQKNKTTGSKTSLDSSSNQCTLGTSYQFCKHITVCRQHMKHKIS